MMPIKHAATFLNGAAFKPSDWGDAGLPILRIAQLTGGEFDNYFDGSINRGHLICNGDLLFSWSATIDAFIWDRGDAILNQHIFKVLPKKNALKKYLYYVIKAHAPRWADDDAHGSTMRHIKKESLSNKVWIPDLDTQKSVVDFLDREISLLDQMIEKKQRLSGILDEKLADETLNAVTLGIDGSAELVPSSELEWTVSRPKHWKIVRLKYFFSEKTQYSANGEEMLLSLRMKEGLVPHNDVSDKELLPSDLIGYKKVFPGQIVMNRMRAAIGLFGLSDFEGIVSPDYSIFDVGASAHAGYFLRLFKTEPMKAAFRLLSKGLGTGHSGFMRLNSDNFGRIRVAVPEFEEQREISRYVEVRTKQINELQKKNQLSIDRLKEFRTALIKNAVSGEIDVATWGKSGHTDRRLDQIEEDMALREVRA